MAGARQRRTQPENALTHPTRARLLDMLRRDPGTTMGILSQDLGLARGTAAYHLRLLEGIGVVHSHAVGHARFFYPADASAEDRRGIAVLRRRRAIEIVHVVRSHPGIGQSDLLRLIGMKRKVFRSYIRSLVEEGLVAERWQQRHRVYEATGRLEQLLARTALGSKAGPWPGSPTAPAPPAREV